MRTLCGTKLPLGSSCTMIYTCGQCTRARQCTRACHATRFAVSQLESLGCRLSQLRPHEKRMDGPLHQRRRLRELGHVRLRLLGDGPR